ncbi:hypothetical protein [Candidatus Nephthysia bennettiae]|uniref:hypothetical protein n=1 Tax=Candidatus Nephthysia bennettiae TaxID=3127016 RepID=UPI0030C6C102
MTIVNVALPSIGQDLHFTSEGLAWVINGSRSPSPVFCCWRAGSPTCVAPSASFWPGW